MNPRHAAALALVGWYLMVPPQPVGKWQERPPISKWEQLGSYDTADECQKDQLAHFLRLAQTAKTSPADNAIAEQYVTGKCVASDDPRLKEK